LKHEYALAPTAGFLEGKGKGSCKISDTFALSCWEWYRLVSSLINEGNSAGCAGGDFEVGCKGEEFSCCGTVPSLYLTAGQFADLPICPGMHLPLGLEITSPDLTTAQKVQSVLAPSGLSVRKLLLNRDLM